MNGAVIRHSPESSQAYQYSKERINRKTWQTQKKQKLRTEKGS